MTATIQVRTTRAQKRAYMASFYGQPGGNKQFVADMLAGRVLNLKPLGKDHRPDYLCITSNRASAFELTKQARELGLTRSQYIKMLAFNVRAAANRVPGKWGNITVQMTDAQRAAYGASTYGSHGGGSLLVRDLLAGTVQRLDAPRDSGERERVYISASKRDRDALLRMARARGMNRSDWVHAQLFGINAQGAARRNP